MVKCILNGKVTELGESQNLSEKDPEIETIIECIVEGQVLHIKDNYRYTPPEPIEENEIDEVGRNNNSKVVEDCFDENGRPRLKIVYLHTDGSDENRRVICMWFERFLDAERDNNDEYCLMTGNNSDPPRVIVVVQDKDYWPGSELEDPLVLERRLTKEKEYKEAFPYKQKPDYKEVDPVHYFGDDGSRLSDDYVDINRRMYENYTNPDLPGYEFLMENFSNSGLLGWKTVSHPKIHEKEKIRSQSELLLKKRKRSPPPPSLKRFGPNAAGDFSLNVPIPKRRISGRDAGTLSKANEG